MKRLILFGAMVLAVVSISAAEDNYLFHSIRTEVFVGDAPATSDMLSLWAESVGGYYLSKSDPYVVIRFPYDHVGDFLELVENRATRILRLDPSAQDLREEIRRLSTGITSRQEVLDRNLEFIDQTDVAGTLEIEREVLRLLQEIENMKGQLQKYEVDRRYAIAWISLRITEQELPENIPSSFAWINTVDFYSFIGR